MMGGRVGGRGCGRYRPVGAGGGVSIVLSRRGMERGGLTSLTPRARRDSISLISVVV